jgi:hypothetical protein
MSTIVQQECKLRLRLQAKPALQLFLFVPKLELGIGINATFYRSYVPAWERRIQRFSVVLN